MRKRTSDYYSSDTEQMATTEDDPKAHGAQEEFQDVFLMRPQLDSGKMGSFLEAKRLYDNGTNEVRQLLLQECSLIYECNACRNMFRRLSQFISHKRVYCRCSAVDGDGGSAGGDKCIGLPNLSGTIEETAKENNAWKPKLVDPAGAKKSCHGNYNTDENKQQMNVTIEKQDFVQDTQQSQNNIMNLTGNITETTPFELAIKQFSAGYEDAVSRLEHFLSASCQICMYCNTSFSHYDELSTHLLHCPMMVAATALKLQQSDAQTEQNAHITNQNNNCTNNDSGANEKTDGVKEIEIGHTAPPAQSVINSTNIKTEAVPSNAAQSKIQTLKKKRLRSHQKTVTIKNDISVKVLAKDTVMTRIKEEPTSEPECSLEDAEKEESKKLKSSCPFCEKSFERRAALSAHLQNCRVKNGILEKSEVNVQPINRITSATNAKRTKLQSSIEKIAKEPRLHPQLTATVVEDPETELLNEMFANLGGKTFGLGLRTVTLDQDDLTVSTDEAKTEDATEMEAEKAAEAVLDESSQIAHDENTSSFVYSNAPTTDSLSEVNGEIKDAAESAAVKTDQESEKTPRNSRGTHAEKRLLCRCKICNKQFTALSNLRRHISMFHYRAQRFGCTLCDYRAFRRYDIVNHLGNSHSMKGDPEAMSIEFVSEHEVKFTKEDVELDIVVLTEKDVSATIVASTVESKFSGKRIRRNRTISLGNGSPTSKITRQKLKRSHFQHENSICGNAKPLQRRPIRNRIKPVNKDFVYDLSSFLKKDPAALSELTRTLRRRNTTCGSAVTDAGVKVCNVSLLGETGSREHIRGTAQRLLLSLVNRGLAASATQPELPAERPQMRHRLISFHRPDTHAVPVIETDELEAARLKSTLLADTFLEKVAKGSASSFKIKPSLALHNSKISWFLEKVDSSLHNYANGKSTPIEELSNGDGSAQQESPPPSISKAAEPPSPPRKRISMLERLTENRLKYRESLLRSALEN